MTPGWAWPREGTPGRSYTRDDLGRYDSYPVQATLTRELEDAGFVRSEESTWRDQTKKGSAFATLFADVSGARTALAAYRTFARRWQSEIEGADVTDVPVEGLGEESWGIRQDQPGAADAESVTYDWRRDNLVLEVHIVCGHRCPSDIGHAARSWADATMRHGRARSVRLGKAPRDGGGRIRTSVG